MKVISTAWIATSYNLYGQELHLPYSYFNLTIYA